MALHESLWDDEQPFFTNGSQLLQRLQPSKFWAKPTANSLVVKHGYGKAHEIQENSH